MLPFESMAMNVLLLLGVAVVGWGVRLLLFVVSWALADLPDQAPGKTLLAVTPVWAFALALVFVGDMLLVRFDPALDSGFGLARILTAVVAVVLAACLAAPLYAAFLSTGPRKGAFVAASEAVLTLFAAALVTATVMVVVALVQVARRADAAPATPAAPAVARALPAPPP